MEPWKEERYRQIRFSVTGELEKGGHRGKPPLLTNPSPKEVDASCGGFIAAFGRLSQLQRTGIFSPRRISKCSGQEKVQGLVAFCGLHQGVVEIS